MKYYFLIIMENTCLYLFSLTFILFNAKNFRCSNVISRNDFNISHADAFPHNIDQDFSININHPIIKDHHLYAVLKLEVKDNMLKEPEHIFIYPGFLPRLEKRLKENYFHVMSFETVTFNTKIVLRFYRASHGGQFSIMYSPKGAENIHLQMPKDYIYIYKQIIQLFRPPIIKLVIKTEDDHRNGLTINKRGLITCSANDGFPQSPIDVKFQNNLIIIKQIQSDSVEIHFIAQLKDHLNKVTCTSGGVSVEEYIYVFHHPYDVEIIPNDQLYLKQNSELKCKSIGGGYPDPVVKWTVNNLTTIKKNYFNVTFSKYESSLTINSNVPNLTKWQFNCSSLNYIPHLVHGGAYKVINITIGENPEAAQLAANRLWTITIVSVVLLIVFLIGLLCFGSKFRCKSKSKKNAMATCPDVSTNMDYIHVKQDEDKDSICKNSFV